MDNSDRGALQQRLGTHLSWTLHDQYEFTKQRSAGFDYLRLILALSIVFYHAFFLCYGWSAGDYVFGGPIRPLAYFLVPCFFALSGFLVTGSLERNKLPVFFTLRALRIVPALAVEVLISAFIIGSLLTQFTWREYFSDAKFWHYLLNVIGDVHFQLPGMFLNNPMPDNVNGQLWTVPFELECYVILGALALLGIAFRARWVFFLTVMLVIYQTVYQLYGAAPQRLLAVAPGRMLIMSCMFGVWMYVARRHIPYSWPLFIVAVALTWFGLSTVDLVYVSTLPLAYVTLFIGLMNPPRIKLLTKGDYSYGLYLYSFPIQQSIVQLLPHNRHWALNAALGLVVGGFCAFCSWHFVESKVLAQRKPVVKQISILAAQIEAQARRLWARLPRPREGHGTHAQFGVTILGPWWHGLSKRADRQE